MNTYDVEEGVEALHSPTALREWLSQRGLLAAASRVGTEDLGRAVAVREALRALLLANGGGELDPSAPVTLDEASRRAGLGLRFTPGGLARVEPQAEGVDGALGQILARAVAAMQDGSWSRLKACPAHDCQWAFYDRSRNRSGVWCDMAVCGNRTKVRAYRERRGS